MSLLKSSEVIEIISKSKDCHFCKSQSFLIVHHIDRNAKNNPRNGSNWLILCRSCHQKLHFYMKCLKEKDDLDIRQKIILFVKLLAIKYNER